MKRKKRNEFGNEYIFIKSIHPLAETLIKMYESIERNQKNMTEAELSAIRVPLESTTPGALGVVGAIHPYPDAILPGDTSLSILKQFPPIDHVDVVSAIYECPPQTRHVCDLLPGYIPSEPVLTQHDIQESMRTISGRPKQPIKFGETIAAMQHRATSLATAGSQAGSDTGSYHPVAPGYIPLDAPEKDPQKGRKYQGKNQACKDHIHKHTLKHTHSQQQTGSHKNKPHQHQHQHQQTGSHKTKPHQHNQNTPQRSFSFSAPQSQSQSQSHHQHKSQPHSHQPHTSQSQKSEKRVPAHVKRKREQDEAGIPAKSPHTQSSKKAKKKAKKKAAKKAASHK